MTYTAINYRYTQEGWVMDVSHNGASLPISIMMDKVNAADCTNFTEAYRAQKTLPYDAQFGDVFPVDDLEAELQADAEWLDADTDPALDRLNKSAGYDVVTAICTKSPERLAWEAEYLAKRTAHVQKYWSNG